MLEGIVAILAGLLLLSSVMRSDWLRPLMPFSTVIGVVALVAGVLSITSVIGVALILAGLILAASTLASVPSIGTYLANAGRWLDNFRVVIGVLVLVLGLLALF